MPVRKLSALLHLLFGAALCLLTAGCFDTHEELWVNPDGSARAEFRYHVPKRALMLVGGADGLERQTRELVATLPELRIDKLTITPQGDDVELAADLSTDSLLWLRDLKKNAALGNIPERTIDFAGEFRIRLEKLQVNFNRTVKIGDALGFTAIAIGDEDRQSRKLYCAIHLPLPATESNATRTEDEGRTLIWETSLGDALKQPVITHFSAPIPLPRWLIPTAGGAAIALLVISWLAVRWWRKRRASLRTQRP